MFRAVFIFGVVAIFAGTHGANESERTRRQNGDDQSGQVIDSIFNIPITAIKQTAAAAHSIAPDNTQTIDSVLQIPISTLEAVGNLVKARSAQRRQNAGEIDQLRQDRRERVLAQRERVLAQRERQRLQRELLQKERNQEKQLKKLAKHHNKDPLGLNAWSNLLVGNHGLLSGHHGVASTLGHHGTHGLLGGGHGGHGIHGILANVGNNRPQHTYEVHEEIDEVGPAINWQGITSGIGNFFGTQQPSDVKIENKIAPKDEHPIASKYEEFQIQNKVTPIVESRSRYRYENELPVKNRIGPASNRISFYR